MIRRLLTGLAGLLVLVAGLAGLPAFLLGAQHQLADLMPSLGDLPSTLLAPGDGGLFLLTVLGVGWICWAVFVLAFLVEIAARVRGIRTPRLGPFLPQRTAAWAITAVTMLGSLTTAGSGGSAATASASAPAHSVSQTHAASAPEPTSVGRAAKISDATAAHPSERSGAAGGSQWRDYRVKRGDTLWDIADRKLGDPTEWPSIANASDEIRQPNGRHLEDPDLILPGWQLHIPKDAPSNQPAAQSDVRSLGREGPSGTAPPEARESAPLPTTPLHPPELAPDPEASEPAGSCLPENSTASPEPGQEGGGISTPEPHSVTARVAVAPTPSTPLHPATTAAAATERSGEVLQLPAWVREPLIPARYEEAPGETRARVLFALADRTGLGRPSK